VQFEGLISFSQEEAAEIMNLSTKFGNKPIFNQELTRQARDVLVNRYKDRGYWDAKIFDPRVIKNPGTSEVKLVYVIKEGKRRLFEDLIVSGNKAMSVADISQILKTSEKEPLAWQQLIEFEKELRASYRLLGYLQVDMNIELVQNRQFRDIETRILLTIQEGPRARFGEITVKGLVKTDADIVTRELRFKSGDWYDPLAIEESRQALVDLGLFSSVSITPSDSNPSGKNALIAYTVYLREARSGSVSFGPGWSLADGMRFSIEGSYNNIGGRGRKIFSKGTLSEEKNQAPLGDKTLLGRYTGVGYLEPYLFNYPVDGTLTFNHKALARAQSWEISRSAEAIASHRIRGLSPRTDLSLFTLYKETREEAEAGIRRATLMESGNLQVREIGIRHTTDARNNKGWPTRGYRLVTEFSTADFVFGGDLKYTRWSMNYNIYRELRTNFVIAAGIGFTSYNNILRHNAPNVLPTSERLPSGGPESNRGFRDNSLGPVFITTDNAGKSLEIYDGGSRRGSQRLELRYQAVQDTFAVTSFIDASNSFFSSTEENLIRQEFSRSASADTKSPEFYDNQPYELDTLIRHPNYIWTRNYVSYGLSGNLLTP
ncbi:MAG: BamA/TamA family outer membrane protein, partial [Proteobacteria bacterium]|nr:BamA/TamA family outer membrane protein [Pseudomonadota bacterium]